MDVISMKKIGTVRTGTGFSVQLDKAYAAGLEGLTGFTHVYCCVVCGQSAGMEREHACHACAV